MIRICIGFFAIAVVLICAWIYGSMLPFSPFVIVGLISIVVGIIQLIKDHRTKKYGIECFGIVRNIETANVLFGMHEIKATVRIIHPETYSIENIEIVGLGYDKYPINAYVLCKYYKNDFNIVRIISEDEIPEKIKDYLVPRQNSNKIHQIDDDVV